MIREYALVSPAGAVVDRRWLEEADVPPPGTLSPLKSAFLVIEREDPPVFDSGTEVLEGPAEVVEPERVLVAYTVRAKTAEEIAAEKVAKRAQLSAEFSRRAYDLIEHTVGGEALNFDADKDALENISGVLVLIGAGVPMPDPRPWTAHGSLTPVDVTHAELIGLGAAIAARKDALYVVKKTKEAALASMTEAADVAAFDPLAGWGA